MKNKTTTFTKELIENINLFCNSYSKKSSAVEYFVRNSSHDDLTALFDVFIIDSTKDDLEHNVCLKSAIEPIVDKLTEIISKSLPLVQNKKWESELSQFKNTLSIFFLYSIDELNENKSSSLEKITNKIDKEIEIEQIKHNIHPLSSNYNLLKKRNNLSKMKSLNCVLFDHGPIREGLNFDVNEKEVEKLESLIKEISDLYDIRNTIAIKEEIIGNIRIMEPSIF